MRTLTFDNPLDLTADSISKMNLQDLIENAVLTFSIDEPSSRSYVQALMEARAMEFKGETMLRRLFSAYNKADKKNEQEFKLMRAQDSISLPLKLDKNGVPVATIDNFLLVMRNDPWYDRIKFNQLLNAPEVHDSINGEIKISRWYDTDEAESRHYMEHTYRIYSETKHYAALRILFREREYNPIQDIVDALEWDGVERCEKFLIEWARTEDSPYAREVSRLIFAGGINRLYQPGCKFDDVPVLIGTSQGEGKSTLVKWLAINDSYFSEVKEMDGTRSIEQLEGAWICEVAELLALTKAKEQEAVKSYITCQRDKYRRPYDKQVSEYPRRCIFIGTTNNEQFLKDKTGNRRFYPIKVNSSGYWLYDHEEECREYILQCWAEARVKYERGEMPNFANRALLEEFKTAQNNAMEDDWRVGALEAYLAQKQAGDLVCIRQLKHEALCANPEFPVDPTPKESQEISIMMNQFPEWEKAGRKRVSKYGLQRCWVKKSEYTGDTLPF